MAIGTFSYSAGLSEQSLICFSRRKTAVLGRPQERESASLLLAIRRLAQAIFRMT